MIAISDSLAATAQAETERTETEEAEHGRLGDVVNAAQAETYSRRKVVAGSSVAVILEGQPKKLIVAALLAVVSTAPASAALFNFSYNGTGGPASGTFTTTDTTTLVGGRQAYTVTAISGSRGGVSVPVADSATFRGRA